MNVVVVQPRYERSPVTVDDGIRRPRPQTGRDRGNHSVVDSNVHDCVGNLDVAQDQSHRTTPISPMTFAVWAPSVAAGPTGARARGGATAMPSRSH